MGSCGSWKFGHPINNNDRFSLVTRFARLAQEWAQVDWIMPQDNTASKVLAQSMRQLCFLCCEDLAQ